MAVPNRHPHVDRRTLLRGAGGGAVAATWLVACGGDDPEAGSDASTTPDDPGSGDAKGGGGKGGGGDGGDGEALVSTSEVEVGAGVIIDQKYVVTQPTRGHFKAFSAICTHSQCPVAEVSDGEIRCNCHGSAYSIEDGSVTGGPAPAPLPGQAITVKGDEVLLG